MDAEPLLTQKEGESPTLQSFIDAGQLHQWLYNLIRPFVKGRVLEIWSGEGIMASFFLQDNLPLRISDPHRSNYATLKEKFEKGPIIQGIYRINLYDPEFETTYKQFLGEFHTVLSINAIEKDVANPSVLKNANKLLKERGRLIILLPAQTILYEESDEGLEELRRWNQLYAKDLLGSTVKIHHFFSVSDAPQSIQLSLYSQQVPSFQIARGASSCQPGLYIIAMTR
ncbi:MAG TPA: hypothetical protein VGM30_04435 [Puia sp.]|jgi:hypothetical protein